MTHDAVTLPDVTPPLSPRQMEVAELLAAGLSRGEIARELGISERTVRAHLERLDERLPGAGNVWARATRFVLLMGVGCDTNGAALTCPLGHC